MVSLGREQCLLRQLRLLNIFSSNFLRGAPQKGRPLLFTVTFWFTVTFLVHSHLFGSQSVPSRGSGWVAVRTELYLCKTTHPLPRDGTDCEQPNNDRYRG